MKRIYLAILSLFLSFSLFAQAEDLRPALEKYNYLLNAIHYRYVDKVPLAPLVEKATIETLHQLDPHSQYISPKDVAAANVPLQSHFDGIGIAFRIIKDTIVVQEAISGGPSEKLGITAGDRIVTIDGKNSTGDSATEDYVFRNLRGKKGTIVTVGILRHGVLKDYKIVRDKIPDLSVKIYFMENATTGYILVQRFAKETANECKAALQDLIQQGAKNIILDLRGNTGGYMDQAVKLADVFLKENQLIVYMEGASQPREESFSTSNGLFEKGKLVVLIDERSASASEIVSGAIQDHDRGLIVGRRSFGKGLVQQPLNLPDKSEVRLTIARYYTPSGRCIQKPYDDGFAKYFEERYSRYTNGELLHPDSIKLPDSLKFFTDNQRVVYGGGGIVPDIFTPIDTNRISDYFVDLRRANVFGTFISEYVDRERTNLLKTYPTFNDFNTKFNVQESVYEEFEAFAEKAGVTRNRVRMASAESLLNKMLAEMKKDTTLSKSQTYSEYAQKALWSEEKMKEYIFKLAEQEDAVQRRIQAESDEFILLQLKAQIASSLYGEKCYYQITSSMDDAYQRALKTVEDEKLFKKLKISY